MPAAAAAAAAGAPAGSTSAAVLNTAAVALHLPVLPAWLLKRSRLVVWTWISMVALWLAYFFACNQDDVSVELGLMRIEASVARWSLLSFGAGVSVSAAVFWLRQGLLAAAVETERNERKKLESKIADLNDAYAKLRAAAQNVCVPFPLSELVEKAFITPDQMSDVAYRPRQLHAGRSAHS